VAGQALSCLKIEGILDLERVKPPLSLQQLFDANGQLANADAGGVVHRIGDGGRCPHIGQFAQAFDAGRIDVVIDLGDLEWTDSAGRSAIARAVRFCDKQGYEVSLLRPHSPAVRRVLEMSGLDAGVPFVGDA